MTHRRAIPIYSVASEYAVRALVCLARRPDGAHVKSIEIAQEAEIPQFSLPAVLRVLVRQGMLSSGTGRLGGFTLDRSPAAIHLADIVRIMDGDASVERCAMGYAQCSHEHPCAMHGSWCQIRQSVREFLHTVTIAELAKCSCKRAH